MRILLFSGANINQNCGFFGPICNVLSYILVILKQNISEIAIVYYRILVEMTFGTQLLTFTALILVLYFNNFNVSADDGCPEGSWKCGDTCM